MCVCVFVTTNYVMMSFWRSSMNSRWCRPRARQIRASRRAWRWYAHKLNVHINYINMHNTWKVDNEKGSMTKNNRKDTSGSCIHPSIRAWSLGSQAFSNSPSTFAAAFGRNGVLGGMSSPKLGRLSTTRDWEWLAKLWRLILGTFCHRGHTAHYITVFFCLIEY